VNNTKNIPQPLDILYEDNHLIIVNKKPGAIVQGDKTGDTPLLEIIKDYIKEKYNKPGDVFLGLVHRLDRPVSGIVIFARTSKALERMNQIFKNRLIEKKYWAIVKNQPSPINGSLVHFLIKNNNLNKSFVCETQIEGAKKGELTYKTIATSKTFFLLEIELHTGRHHQIRAQLSSIGCPIKGDLKYGFNRSNTDGSINLHAAYISFEHPVKKEKISVSAPPPDEPTWALFYPDNI